MAIRKRTVACILIGICILSLSIWYRPTSVPPIDKKDPPSTPHAVDYKRDVLPILASRCFVCHGPDPSTRKAGVRLDLREAAMKKSRSGVTPIVPGKPDESEMLRRIHADGDERMPPVKSGKTLSDPEKILLKKWIEEGAEYQLHWAFVKPERPKAPGVKNRAWVKNEIDAFVLAKLEEAGLTPSSPADPVTLIRRLSLDLTGLPPTIADVEEFAKAWDASGANRQALIESTVDRLLASPHYGEKMALAWLDLARYGDTSGYHMDSTRQMWLWREWVIDAFNKDMPFDQFTIEQIAGDLLTNATTQQKIASGFNRNTRFNEEGGVDPEEYVIRYNVDRTNTLGQVWLGLTLGCAECHTHKYDPITHAEYYQLFAYFTGITEPMVEGASAHFKPLYPILRLPTPEQEKTLVEHRKTLDALEKVIAKELSRVMYVDPLDGKSIPIEPTDEQVGQSQRAWELRAAIDAKLPAAVMEAVKLEPAKRSDAQRKLVREHYLRKIHSATREEVGLFDREAEELTQKMQKIEEAIPHTLVSEEMPNPRPAHVLIRGDFQQKAERVERGVPAVFPPLAKDAPANRLGLARWLISPEHPLTARVTVNRLWTQMFGQGIVRTLGDFGTQGDYPSHPELLDWLAVEFMQRGWSTKRIFRTIALSSTYQQASIHRSDAVKLDPHNRLLAFMPRYRLGAEELRDSALAISGLLSRKLGGASFMPYQPNDYYKFKNEDWPWKATLGDEQYRRGLYAFWRRTALHPMLVALDAPTREECVVLRGRTNTPLNAFVTLNDPTFVEAARVFAQKLLTEGPKEHDKRLAYVFRKATCRPPTADELAILRRRYQQQHERFAKDTDAASRMVNAGQYPIDPSLNVAEHAAWTALCNMILNLDEVLTRE